MPRESIRGIELNRPFCRGAELADIVSAIRAEDCRAVFLTSDSGLGASTTLRRLAEEAGEYVPVLAVHGSQSLAKIPFGVLAPHLGGLQAPVEAFRLGALREILQEIDRIKADLDARGRHSTDLPLLVIDDAHFIDNGTAELVVSLVMAGSVNVVASHSSRHRLPAPLPKLWASGLAENIDLLALSRDQGHEFCEAMLGGPVLLATSWHYWSMAAGNPLFLHLVVAEAMDQGLLALRNGIWVGEHAAKVRSYGLEEAVRAALRGLSPEGQAALNLVALSEPLAEKDLRALVDASDIQELLDWPLVSHLASAPELLVLANPLYGQVIREMVPLAKSRQLHEQLMARFNDGAGTKEALLRRAVWAVEVGVEIPDETMLQAAVLACKMFQSTTALELAGHINSEPFRLRANMVRARAKYNLGDYQGAFLLLESLRDHATGLEDILFGALLHASTRSALGMPVATLLADARDLREAGRRLAAEDPAHAESILAQCDSTALMVELLADSRTGRYSDMTALAELLNAQHGLSTTAEKLNRTMALAMDSERLTAQGFPEQGSRRAAEAFAIEHSEENDVFFLPESIMLRQVAALLCAGDWATAAETMNGYFLEAGPVVYSFGGSANVVRGMILVRAGRYSEALAELQGGLEPLRLSNPQQLLGFCTAMASYAAARLGLHEQAAQFIAEHRESTGIHVVLAHERAYLAAARHLVAPESGGLAALFTQADAAHVEGASMLELNALALALELGENSVAGRAAAVAAGVEGQWARSVGVYAAALHERDGVALAHAAEVLTGAGLLGFAQLALARSAKLLGATGSRKQELNVRKELRRLAASVGSSAEPDAGAAASGLTRREREVATLASTGMTDREIADELTLALRTVEGHLYRTYTKLGISTREELPGAL